MAANNPRSRFEKAEKIDCSHLFQGIVKHADDTGAPNE